MRKKELEKRRIKARTEFFKTKSDKGLFLANIIIALGYFYVLAFLFPRSNVYLFWFLIAGEIYHLWMLLTYLYTVWDMKKPDLPFNHHFQEPVDVFITVAGEPVEIVRETALAAKKMDYPGPFRVYILNDGYVAKKDNWMEIENMAKEIGVNCITRSIPGGAKAGNYNHGLRHTSAPFIASFDADHVPYRNFLKETMGYFEDDKMGFVQTPQFYKNHFENSVTAGAWEQQALFFGAMCQGKDRLNSVFLCGTNMVIRRRALEEVGGLMEKSITEDFVTSQLIHQKGWKSTYIPRVLAEGLAPEDMLSYYKQQFRWARGSLEVVFKYNPLFKRNLTWAQKIQYLASASFYLSGLVVLMNALLPLIFLVFGITPFQASTMLLAAAFIPFIYITINNLRISTNSSFTFRALSFSMSTFDIQVRAFLSAVFNRKVGFAVTSKKKLTGNFLNLVTIHIIYSILIFIGIVFAILREGLNASVVTNISWALFNVAVFIPFILAALPVKRKAGELPDTAEDKPEPQAILTGEDSKVEAGRIISPRN